MIWDFVFFMISFVPAPVVKNPTLTYSTQCPNQYLVLGLWLGSSSWFLDLDQCGGQAGRGGRMGSEVFRLYSDCILSNFLLKSIVPLAKLYTLTSHESCESHYVNKPWLCCMRVARWRDWAFVTHNAKQNCTNIQKLPFHKPWRLNNSFCSFKKCIDLG